MPIFLPPERWVDVARECAAVWQDLDLNTYRCPADTIGVMIAQQMPEPNLRRNNFGIRKNGSTDDGNRAYRASGTRTVDAQAWKVAVTGCDANKIIETYLTTNHTPTVRDKIWIIGWFLEGEAVFFDNFELPDDAGWRAAWVDDKTWYELDMSSVEPPGGPPTAYIFSQYNGHWGSGNYILLPSGRQTGPEGALNNVRFYETHGTFHVCPPGANNNVAFVSYGTSANIEAQVIGYLAPQSGFTDVGNMLARVNTPGIDGFTYDSRALADFITVPDNTVAVSLYTKTGAGGCIGGSRDYNPRSSIQYSEGYGNYGGPPALITEAGNLFEVSGKWQDFVVLGVYTKAAAARGTPQPPDYSNRTNFRNDPVNVDLAAGWVGADPDGFTADQLPAGLSMSLQGQVTGTPTAAVTTTVTVTNLGLPDTGGSVIDRPEGALFYDDFFQYDARQSVEGTDPTTTYGTWRAPTWPTLQFAPPDLVNFTLQRPSTSNSSSVATYYAVPLNVCIAFTMSGLWKNPESDSSTLTIYMRQAVDGTASYRLIVSPSFNTAFDLRIVRRLADGSSTTLASVLNNTQGFANGDRIRWQIENQYHRVWYKNSSGAEVQLLSFNDPDASGVAPGNTPGEVVLRWEKNSGTKFCPISDFGIWPAGGFVEYTPRQSTGEIGVAASTLPPPPTPQTTASFDWTIINKPVAPTYSPLYHRQGGAVNVNLATGWTNANPSGFSSGNLPDGLSMSSTGVVTGTPTTLQTTSAVVYNGTAAGTITADAFAWEIFLGATPPAYPPRNHYANDLITPIDLRVGWDNETLNQFFADQLPTGLSLASNGSVTGTPTVVEAVSVTIRNGLPPRETFADPFLWSIFTKPVPPAYSPLNNNTNDVVNIDLSVGWTDANPTGFAANGLPEGLTMSSAGVVTGTATKAQVVSTTVTNDAGAGPVGANAFVWTVAGVVTPPNYPDRVGYVGDVIDVDLSEGWILP